MNSRSKLDSIARFAKAGAVMGTLHVNHARKEFDESGHSCYEEGWARGYLVAMETVEKFILDTIAEVAAHEQ